MTLSLQIPNLPRFNDMEGEMRAFLKVSALVAVALLAAACGPAATPAPTATPQPVLATRIEDIVGTWQGIGFDGLFQRFNPDGTLQVGLTLEGTGKPDALLDVRVEGTHFVLTEVQSTSLSPCGTNFKTGTYEVQLLPNGNIQFNVIEDLCGHRRRSMTLEHKPVPSWP
jgi:hypothetical protein